MTSLFVAEATLLGAIGTALGLPIGKLLARGAVEATATTVETFYIATAATEHAEAQSLELGQIALAFAATIPLAGLAAWFGSRDAVRIKPVEAARRDLTPASTRPRSGRVLAAALAGTLSVIASFLPAWDGLPLFGYASAILFLLAVSLIIR